MKRKLSLVVGLVLAVATLIIWTQKENTMAHASDYVIDRNYYIVIRAQGAWFNVMVNGITMQMNSRTEPFNTTMPINHLMQSDNNRITYNFVPIRGRDDQGETLFGPHGGFYVHISIESINLETRARERITLVDARYDMETGELISNEKTIFETEPVYQQANMHTTGDLRLKTGFKFVDAQGPDVPSQHLIAEFHTTDRFPRFHWLDEATVLEDTPELREGLRNAYRHIHDLMERGDFRGIRKLMDDRWRHTAIAMNLGRTADDFIRHGEPHKDYVKKQPDGSILRPLHFDERGTPLDQDHLQFMAEGRVVRLVPDPIIWQPPDARTTTRVRFVFYVTEDLQWKVAAIVAD
ncbi:MAG: hypothetical protein ACK4L8_06735 [Nitrincola lacisaponensis]|uniref:hypothetical protein n=1 Tax=Nitrincola lacisaponensis TaxID=267850 RepID=UPI003918EE8A